MVESGKANMISAKKQISRHMDREIKGTGMMAELADIRDGKQLVFEETKEQIIESNVGPYHRAEKVAQKEDVSFVKGVTTPA